MTKGIFKRKSPVQEKLAKMEEIILKDALSREKSVKELANIYGVCSLSLSEYYKNNGIKKLRKNVKYKYGYIRGSYKNKIKELRNYIKENDITKEEIVLTILSIRKVKTNER